MQGFNLTSLQSLQFETRQAINNNNKKKRRQNVQNQQNLPQEKSYEKFC